MSGYALVTIFCDHPGCARAARYGLGKTAAEARANMAGEGWQLNVRDPRSTRHTHYPRLDYCPQHTNDKED